MANNEELLRRCRELSARSEARGMVTHTGFLTPAERYALERAPGLGDGLLLTGGGPDCERQAAFFLPDYLAPESFDPQDYLTAFHVLCRFGSPGHRDVLGSLLGLGIERWCLGDIHTEGESAWFYCLPSVAGHIASSLTKVGRSGAKLTELPLDQVPKFDRRRQTVSFTVSSLRLDAVISGSFGLSRGQAAGEIAAGQVQLNYDICQKPDAPVSEGDVFSLRHRGKAALLSVGGRTKKDRISLQVEKYL